MPNPLKKFFRRPTVKRVKKVASRQFRKFFPERGFYDIRKYRDRGAAPEWLSKQVRLEDAAWDHGLQPRPYKGRRHSLEPQPHGGDRRGYHSFEGYMPGGGEMLPDFSQSMSMSNLSEMVGDSRDNSKDFYDRYNIPEHLRHQPTSPPDFMKFQPPGVSTPDKCAQACSRGSGRDAPRRFNESAPAAMMETSTTHRELMFMLDQLEMAELERIMRDLRQFQTSRRKLMFDVSSLSSSSSPPSAMMKPTATPQPAAIMAPSSPSITLS